MKPEFSRDGMMGADWLREKGKLPDPANLSVTHVHLKDLELPGGTERDFQRERVYYLMQAEQWSPFGEARGLIKKKGLQHTSMSMGDIVVVDGETHIVDRFGFARL
jgi:hypothetical protein